MRGILPAFCAVLWGLLALSMAGGEFSSREQAFYYLHFPVLMACGAVALLLLRNLRFARILVQVLAVLMLFALLPYLFFYTGGV